MHVPRAVVVEILRFASKGFVGTIGSALWLAAQRWKQIWPNPSSLVQGCGCVKLYYHSHIHIQEIASDCEWWFDTLYFPVPTKSWEWWSWKFERMEGPNPDAHQCTVFPRAVLSESKSECTIEVWTWTLLSRASWISREEVGWKGGMWVEKWLWEAKQITILYRTGKKMRWINDIISF